MIDLNFSREFFAAMLVTEVEKVGFAVLIRTFPDAMELQPKRRPIPKNPVLTTSPNPSLKGRRPLTYAFRRAVDRFYVKKGLTTRSTYFFRNSDSRYT